MEDQFDTSVVMKIARLLVLERAEAGGEVECSLF